MAAEVDVLVLALPGGAARRHVVDGKVLDALGPDGVLINIARGRWWIRPRWWSGCVMVGWVVPGWMCLR
jgi:hypothetical protein